MEGAASHAICSNFWLLPNRGLKRHQSYSVSLVCNSPHPCWAPGGCCEVLVPLPSTEQPASPCTAFCQEFCQPLHSGKSEGKGRKGKTKSCCYCTAQEAWSIYQVDWTNYFATLNSNLLDECCYSWQRKEAAELERGHFAHCSLSSCFVWLR